jgi:hypothetical protein
MKLKNKPKVLAATYNQLSNTRMVSFLIDFPTVLLAELRTHRILTQGSLYEHSELVDFNLSANSARAIPANKYLEKTLDIPFIPIWTRKQKGMSGEILQDTEYKNYQWISALEQTGYYHETLSNEDVHKQNVNRILAPWAWTTCIISGTEWNNFFELRCPKYRTPVSGDGFYAKSKKELLSWHSNQENLDKLQSSDFNWDSINHSTTQPEFQVIAEMLYDLYQEADWKDSKYHIPFEEDIDKLLIDKYRLLTDETFSWEESALPIWIDCESGEQVDIYEIKMKISASMCAKLSYDTQDNEDTLEKHLERADMLIEHKHWEPFSHQAVAMSEDEYRQFTKTFIISNKDKHLYLTQPFGKDKCVATDYGWCYNLNGFISQRYILEQW